MALVWCGWWKYESLQHQFIFVNSVCWKKKKYNKFFLSVKQFVKKKSTLNIQVIFYQ